MNALPPKKCLRNAAFSLVEVTLALGIMSFALLPLVGMLPVGLKSSRSAMDTMIEAQILRGVIGDLRQADFSELDAMNGRNLLFSEQGMLKEEGASDIRYSVTYEVLPPMGPAEIAARSNLRRVRIQIQDRDRDASPRPMHSLLISDNGR